MPGPTVSQIKDRIVTMAGQVSGINSTADSWPDDDFPLTAAELPGIVVTPQPVVQYGIHGHATMVMTRPYTLLIASARTAHDMKVLDQTARESMEPFLISVPLYFVTRPRLEHNDQGLAFGSAIAPDPLTIELMTFNGAQYVISLIVLNVTTIHTE